MRLSKPAVAVPPGGMSPRHPADKEWRRLTTAATAEKRACRRRPGEAAFTMVEIALSIAVVAFAMVAILGVLPTGLQVQKDNREETIINADGAYLMEAIRSGHDRAGLLSNAVYFLSLNYNNGDRDPISANDGPLGLDGQRLVGLLSAPRARGRQAYSNTVAWVRSLSGTAIDRDPEARDVAFRYQLVIDVVPFLGYPPGITNQLHTNDLSRINHLQRNLHEVRLTMRWPLFGDQTKAPQNAGVGTHRRTFRALLGGSPLYYPTNVLGAERMLYFFRPSLY